ncbi:unnamed protein product [Peniophora sp. CBMAI 1063]|nr:unnamed protein product [Peniophora sp. CBMAI 1063]
MVVTTRSRNARAPLSATQSAPESGKQPSPRTSTALRISKRAKPSPPQTPTRIRASKAKATKQDQSRVRRSRRKLPSEYELRPNGDEIIDQLSGRPVLSAYGQRVFHERRRLVADKRAPRPELDNRLRPRYQGIRQPMLHFGLGCNMAHIMDCAKRRGYLTRPRDEDDQESRAKFRVWTHLRFRLIDCTFERALSNEFEFVVALYSNYDQLERQLVEEDEETCLRLIRKELGLGDQEPKWYWDERKSGTYYTAPLDEYNVPNLYSVTVPVLDDE